MASEARKPHYSVRARWQATGRLIAPLDENALQMLDLLPKALELVRPLSQSHRRRLPGAIRSLSALLTCQRGDLERGYWGRQEWLSAYLYYFLPWNLVRLCNLLPGLPLPEPDAVDGCLPLLADAGSGPLTLPLALWIARPDWRQKPLTVFVLDCARKPLEIGKALFMALGELAGQPVWRIRTAQGPLHALAELAPGQTDGSPLYPWLATAANTLNELKDDKCARASENGLDARLGRLLAAWGPLWQNGARMLFVEPGTRLGGATIMRLRAAGLEAGLVPLSPCTHAGSCPLLRNERRGLPQTWCHFVFSAQDAPEWLKELSRRANLFKTSLTLSPLLLAADRQKDKAPQAGLPCRVISRPFPVQGKSARYGCLAKGLGLLPDAKNLVSGSLCLTRIVPDTPNDKKSGALVLAPWQPDGACGKIAARRAKTGIWPTERESRK